MYGLSFRYIDKTVGQQGVFETYPIFYAKIADPRDAKFHTLTHQGHHPYASFTHPHAQSVGP